MNMEVLNFIIFFHTSNITIYMGNHISKVGRDEECVTHVKNGYWWENLKEAA
jgi:hypothetical protein